MLMALLKDVGVDYWIDGRPAGLVGMKLPVIGFDFVGI